MGHDHARGLNRTKTSGSKYAKKLAWALGLTVSYMVAEVIGGLMTGSLALLADAGHMLTDAGGLAMALLAIRFAARPATPEKTYGYLRAEILAALANASVLLLVTVFILYEAYQRFLNPPEIIGGPMLAVAAIGLVVNLVSMRILAGGSSESLNVRGAYFEVLSDMLGSLGVILAAVIVMWTGWRPIDPIIGAGIGLFIVPRTWKLLSETVHILLEGVPAGINTADVQSALEQIDGVRAVHDLHIWTITSGVNALSAHLETNTNTLPPSSSAVSSAVLIGVKSNAILMQVKAMLKYRFNIDHVTIQIEAGNICEDENRPVI